jgi:hypothetical protein
MAFFRRKCRNAQGDATCAICEGRATSEGIHMRGVGSNAALDSKDAPSLCLNHSTCLAS